MAVTKARGVGREVLGIMVPVLIGSILENIYQVTNSALLGRYTDTVTLAAVGGVTAEILLFLSYNLSGVSYATSGKVANKYGNQNYKEIPDTIASGLLLNFGVAVISFIAMLLFGQGIISLLGTPVELVEKAGYYIKWISLGLLAVSVGSVSREVMRALGDAKTPLLCGIITCVISTLMTVLLIAFLGMGINGAIIATLFGQVLRGVATFWLMRRQVKGLTGIDILSRLFKVSLGNIGSVFKTGICMSLEYQSYSLSGIFLNIRINHYGVETIAAFSILNTVEEFFYLVVGAYSVALFTCVSQQYGAQNKDKAHKAVRDTIFPFSMLCLVVAFTLYTQADNIIGLFTKDTTVLSIGIDLLTFLAPMLILYIVTEIATAYTQGCDRAFSSMVITGSFICLARIALVGVVSVLDLDKHYCILVYTSTWVLSGLVYVVYLWIKESSWWTAPMAVYEE